MTALSFVFNLPYPQKQMKLPRGESEGIAMTALGKDPGPNRMKSPRVVKGELLLCLHPGADATPQPRQSMKDATVATAGHLLTADTAPKQNADMS